MNRRKRTLLKKAYEMTQKFDVDIALFLRFRETGRITTFKSIDLDSWPPSAEQIVNIDYTLGRIIG